MTRSFACAVALTAVSVTLAAQQGQPQIGIAPVTLTAGPYSFDTAEQHRLKVTIVARGLAHPFSLAFLPNGDALVSERGVRLRVIRGATGAQAKVDADPVAGLPQMPTFRTGGLHEIALHPKFATNGLIYFTYNKAGDVSPTNPQQRQSAIVLARGKFDGKALTNVQDLFVGNWNNGASGSRLAFGPDGFIYITTGAPFGDQAQDTNSVYGKVLRLRDDGTVPPDNPFVGKQGYRPEVFSMGHRDQLGLTIHPTNGAVLTAEHGPNGGDEVNVILPGRNYGWPLASYGRDYLGPRFNAAHAARGFEEPTVYWVPSIAVSGMTFYDGDRFPNWRRNLFVGGMREGEMSPTGQLQRIVFNDKWQELRRESLLRDLHQRIRDVRQGPDGLLYVVTEEAQAALLRIEPV